MTPNKRKKNDEKINVKIIKIFFFDIVILFYYYRKYFEFWLNFFFSFGKFSYY